MNIIELTNEELELLFHDCNYIYGFLAAKLPEDKKKYLQKDSQFKKLLDKINKIAKEKLNNNELEKTLRE
jgi:hypothetical protein